MKRTIGTALAGVLAIAGLTVGTGAEAKPPVMPVVASEAKPGDKVSAPNGNVVTVLASKPGVAVDNNQTSAQAKTSGKAFKGLPKLPGQVSTLFSCDGGGTQPCMLYNGGRQSASTMAVDSRKGISGTIKGGGHSGNLTGADSHHTLTEVAVQGTGTTGTNTIEVGITVDPVVNKTGGVGSYKPRAFVFSWVNGTPTVYNGGAFVPVSGAAIVPGVTDLVAGQEYTYDVWHDDGSSVWWIALGGNWLGYYPDSQWTAAGETFVEQTFVQLFGEIASPWSTPCSDMGTGLIASNAAASRFGSTLYRKATWNIATSANVNLGTFRDPAATAGAPYANTFGEGPAGSQRAFRFGGPMHKGVGGSAAGNPAATGVIGNPC